MKKIETELKDCYILEPDVFNDNRGYFYEVYNKQRLDALDLNYNFVQANRSYNDLKGVFRGLHFQVGEYSQAKLVDVLNGAVLDIAVDLRKDSPTYKKWIAVELSSENKRQLLIPRGFAHGYLTLTDNVLFEYQVDNFYSKENDGGIFYKDEEINLVLPLEEYGIKELIMSEKDLKQPTLKLSKANF